MGASACSRFSCSSTPPSPSSPSPSPSSPPSPATATTKKKSCCLCPLAWLACFPGIQRGIFLVLGLISWLWGFTSGLACGVCGVVSRVFYCPPIRTFPEIVTAHGYSCSTHQVVTRDGYLLTTFRISKPGVALNPRSPPVLVWHGLLDCAYTWIAKGPSCSLAYALCDAGYDVWLPNNRGNRYCRRHTYMSESQSEFWAFSWDEFAKYDLPDTLDYVLNLTGATKAAYVGHSEGTTQMFAALSATPAIADKLTCFVGLGPVSRIKAIGNPFLRGAAKLFVDRLFWIVGVRRKFMVPPLGLGRSFLTFFCGLCPGVVNRVINSICGSSDGRILPSESAEWGAHEPGGTSVLNMSKWAQSIRTGIFQQYDWGESGNVLRYGTPHPAVYNLANVSTDLPKQFFIGGTDELVQPDDYNWMLEQLKGFEVHHLPGYNHTDYLWDSNVATSINPLVLDFLSKLPPPPSRK
eukprot:gnl/Hemi2/15393_TR5180_c0_g1_i1.p1 gnl/Hemi2/15393_TR5180_c0_g1~~gnl/Hemi2/15393_TR5180_c0_g1_i1.p1  ORF type:complete len:464 (-),score=147.04 gnl/Hemi2/15393_TR5180_c0_g1_i1:184-1575(-)